MTSKYLSRQYDPIIPEVIGICEEFNRERFSIRAVDHPRLPALPAPPPAPSRGRAVGGDSPGYGARGAGTGFR